MSDVLVAIDGNSLLYRAYWAIHPMSNADGRHTHAVYGFFRMMFRLVREYKPAYLTVAFDRHEKTFRHEKYEEYKGGRQKTPDDLIYQLPMLKECLELVGVKHLEKVGYEADDILGTLSKEYHGPTYIVTGDKDQLQLISDTTTVLMTLKGVSDVAVMNEETLREKYDLRPDQIPDLKGLMGDPSDNLPGVAGVGEKTALKLLHEYDTIQNLYDHIDDMPKNKLREKLIAGKDSAFMCRDLAVIDTDVPLDVPLSDLAFNGFNDEGGLEMISRFGFRSFAGEFGADREAVDERDEIPKAPEAEKLGIDVLENLESSPVAVYLSGSTLHLNTGEREIEIDAGRAGSEKRRLAGEALAKAAAGSEVIGFDLKTLMHELSMEQDVFRNCNDCMVAAWVLDPSQNDYRFASVMKRARLPECAASLLTLEKKQKASIVDKNLVEVYDNIEMPLLPVLFRMEENGVRVDAARLEELGQKYEEQMRSLSSEIFEHAGSEFNLGSPKQLSDVLFEKLKLPPAKKTRTGYSTDASVLEKLKDKHPIVPLLMDYRAVAKLKQTYVDGLVGVIRDGYIHTTFLQTATSTGRLSSTEPNLQNIPIHSEMADDIRRAFVAPDGCMIVSADYSQIELRILADMADDENLRAAFERGEDIHARTAAEILQKEIADVSKEERSHAKAVNFGIVYGISDYGLSQSTGLTRQEARSYIEKYMSRFPGVEEYMQNIKHSAQQNGFVKTLYGRVRYIPEIRSRNFNIRSAGERAALNMPIQGTAADIMKIAMIRAFEALEKAGARLVLQVHDELIAYATEEKTEEVKEILRESMEGAAKLAVPLKVNTASGKNWLEAK